MYYLKDVVDVEKTNRLVKHYIYDDEGMKEKNIDDIIKRVSYAFKDSQYLRRVSTSRQRWVDDDIKAIADGIIEFLEKLS